MIHNRKKERRSRKVEKTIGESTIYSRVQPLSQPDSQSAKYRRQQDRTLKTPHPQHTQFKHPLPTNIQVSQGTYTRTKKKIIEPYKS